MNEPDFSGVEPTRLAEACRRIEVVEAYLRIERPSGRQTIEAADSLGLSRWALMRLAQAWRDHRDPTMMVKSKRGPSTRDYGIDERSKAITREEIRKIGMRADLSNVAPAVEGACAKLGIIPPSRPTIYNYILAERREGTLLYGRPPCLLIARMWFHLPSISDETTDLPCAILGVSLPERLVVAFSISTRREAPPQIGPVLGPILAASSDTGQSRDLLISGRDRISGAGVLKQYGRQDIPTCRSSLQRLLAQAFGDRLGNLVPVYRPIAASSKPKYVMGRHDHPLNEAEAVLAISQAIKASNALRSALPPYRIS